MLAPSRSRAGTVLVVEDDAQIRELYRSALMVSRYKVTLAPDGFKALILIEDDRPDVVVLDLGLPNVSGWDVYRDLRSHPETAKLPIIIATGNDLHDINREDLAAVLPKPVDPFHLVATVDRALRHRHL